MDCAASSSRPAIQPALFTVLPKPAGALKIAAAETAKRGDLVEAKLELEGAGGGAFHAFRVEVTGPDGNPVQVLSANLAAPGGTAVWKVPFAVSDAAGEYTLQVRDVPTGISAERKLTLR